jgi:hypothetical protein
VRDPRGHGNGRCGLATDKDELGDGIRVRCLTTLGRELVERDVGVGAADDDPRLRLRGWVRR